MSVELRDEVVIFPHFLSMGHVCRYIPMQYDENVREGENCCNHVCICALYNDLVWKRKKKGCVSISFPADSSTWRGLENIWIGQPQLMQIITLATNPQWHLIAEISPQSLLIWKHIILVVILIICAVKYNCYLLTSSNQLHCSFEQ